MFIKPKYFVNLMISDKTLALYLTRKYNYIFKQENNSCI